VTLEGGDESMWQGAVDWDAVKASGRAFEICKATEGVGYIDPQWAANRAGMLRIGITPGAYHFSRPDLGNSPDAEAEWFLNVVSPGPGWILVHDAESAGGSLAWCDEFERRCATLLGGYHVWFYSYLTWMQSRGIVGSDLLGRSPLWLAWPDVNGPLPFAAAAQQYGSGGLTGGDLDRFFGDASQLAALTPGGLTVSDSTNIALLVTELAPDPATGVLTPGGVADLLLSRTAAIQAAIQAPASVDVVALAAALASHPLTATLSDAERDAVAAHVVSHLAAQLAKP
jgi:hypothetical protein